MAGTSTQDDSSPDALKDVRAKLGKLLAAWPGLDSQQAPDSDTSQNSQSAGTGSTSPAAMAAQPLGMITAARQKYDGIVRWILALFAAVGTLIFGSLPFTDLNGIKWWPWAGLGLILAGAGLVIVIWATTKALEPQDATLGELADAFTLITGAEKADSDGLVRRFCKWFRRQRNKVGPRRRALARLAAIMADESTAQLGPGVSDVRALITRIATLEKLEFAARVGWNGESDEPPANIAENSLLGQQAKLALLTEQLSDSYGLLLALTNALRGTTTPPEATAGAERGRTPRPAAARPVQLPLVMYLKAPDKPIQRVTAEELFQHLEDSPPGEESAILDVSPVWGVGSHQDPLDDRISALLSSSIARLQERTEQTAQTLPGPEVSAEALGKHAVLQAALDTYLGHRTLVLAESALAQLRGTFRLVRLWLLVGAAATLAGGLMYASALANRPADSSSATLGTGTTLNPVEVTILANTAPWKMLTECQPPDKGNIFGLAALLETSDDSDGHQDGPFSAIVTDPACPASITVAQGEGSYRTLP